jgi:phosphatidate phosphatase APP1
MKDKSAKGPFLKHKIRGTSSPLIEPFIGFGNRNSACISGLVVEENGISRPSDDQTAWGNAKSMFKRYLSNELENVKVKVTFGGLIKTVTTNKYGIFRCWFTDVPWSMDNKIWQQAVISLEEPGFSHINATAEIMSITKTPEFGIISDVDDTILVSYATQKLMKIKLMFLNNAHTRMPFEGVAGFYEALQNGSGNGVFNPIFYVSNSEWNLYDLLYEFIGFNRIPKGPLLLREMAIRVLRPWKLREVNKNHKIESIISIFNMYPGMKFILIGDSGQKDPEIYSEVVKRYPNRVPAIYIRDVGIPEKLARIKILSQLVQTDFSTEMVLVSNTEAASKHALENGFITMIPGN